MPNNRRGAARSVYRLQSWRDRVRDPVLTSMLVVQCLIIFVAAPCAAAGYPGSGITLELLLLVLSFLIILVSQGRATTTLTTVAMGLGVIGTGWTLFTPAASTAFIAHSGTIIGGLVGGYIIGRAVFAAGKVTTHRVIGAVVLYLTFGLIGNSAYRLIWDLFPDSLGGIPPGTRPIQAAGTILYFSFVTLTTIGYGDIVPLHPLARSLANLEGIIGQLYPATLLARLVSLELEARRR
jgi:hypothetical protein